MDPRNPINGRSILGNTAWNLTGLGVPVLVAALSIPMLVHGFGNDRFGVLTLIWVLIGYFSLFDLGLGRALTNLVSERLGAGEVDAVPSLFWTSMALMAICGAAGSILVLLFSHLIAVRVLKIPSNLHTETLRSFYLVGVAVPFVIISAGLRGFLEAKQRFDLSNAVRLPLNVISVAGPCALLPFTKSLVPIVALLLAARVVGSFVLLYLSFRIEPGLVKSFRYERSIVRRLLTFGSWMTVSNVISPLLVSMDRFLIGAMISAEAIAYYATPFEIVTKILLLPSALIAVLFPVFSFEFFRKRDRALIVFSSALKFVLLAIFPVVLVTILFAREGLTMWVDSDFGIQGGRVLQWLAAGVLFNSFALAPFALIQGAGRPDVTAKLHMLELPVYLCILWVLIRKYGIEGAAVAWTMRMGMDALALFMLSDCICSVDREFLSKLSIGIAGEFCLLWMASTVTGFYNKLIFLGTASLIVVVFGWRKFLTPSERKIAKAWVPSLGE